MLWEVVLQTGVTEHRQTKKAVGTTSDFLLASPLTLWEARRDCWKSQSHDYAEAATATNLRITYKSPSLSTIVTLNSH